MADVLGEMDQLSVTYTIEDQLAEKELLEIIYDFLGKMNAEDRDIFVRRYWFFDSFSHCRRTPHASWQSPQQNQKTNIFSRKYLCPLHSFFQENH